MHNVRVRGRTCRRLKPPIQSLGILIIWLDSDAKELHCWTPFKQRHCTQRLCCHLQCWSNNCVCLYSSVCLCCVLVALCKSLQDCCPHVWASVCVYGFVCLCVFLRLRFPKQGVFSAANNNVPVIEMQQGKCSPIVTPFSGCAACEVACDQKLHRKKRSFFFALCN